MDWALALVAKTSQLVGFPVLLMLPVFVTVWILGAFLRVREKYPKMKSTIFSLLNVLASIGFYGAYYYVLKQKTEVDMERLVKEGVMIASFTAITYQLFVPSLRVITDRFPQIINMAIDEVLRSMDKIDGEKGNHPIDDSLQVSKDEEEEEEEDPA